jgi:lysophospholipase
MESLNRFFETAESRAPQGAAAHVFPAADGVKLRAVTVPPSAGTKTRGTVVVMNGRAEFFERYYETMRDLSRRGFHVVGFDWRGQGGSTRQLKDRNRGHVLSFRQYDSDLRAIMELLVLPSCPPPYIALAHSTGGHILLRNLLNKSWFQRAVITAPLLDFNYGRWPPWVAFLISATALAAGLGGAVIPGYRKTPFLFSPFDGNPLTSERRRWDRDARLLKEHPELGLGGPSYSWLNAALRSIKQLRSGAYRTGLTCPVLMVLAGRERIVDNRATQEFLRRTPGVASVTINTSLHEILMENDAVRAEFFAAFDSFTKKD